MQLVYVASPYSHEKSSIRTERYQAIVNYMATFLQKYPDLCFYSPITHWHEVCLKHDLPFDHTFWTNQNVSMLNLAKQLWVVCLPGWQNSQGIAMEIHIAQDNDIPIRYIDAFGV